MPFTPVLQTLGVWLAYEDNHPGYRGKATFS